jgi:DNA mismatch endonuclease, patch repair protein
MIDLLTKERRSWNMSQIRCKDTKPELIVRSLLHRNGYRFRLHVKDMPGKPDIVLAKFRTIIFVHGCFWHRHKNCPDATLPKTRSDFWTKKLTQNRERDRKNEKILNNLGWKVIIVWECEIKNPAMLINRLRKVLNYQQVTV